MAGENELNVSFDETDPAEEEIVVSIGGELATQSARSPPQKS